MARKNGWPGNSATGVARGEFDAALVAGATAPSDPLRLNDTGPISRSPITAAAQPLAVVLPLDHPLADRRSLRLADLSGSLWIDAPNAAIPLSDLSPHKARTSIRYDGADVSTVLALAAAGHGLTLVPSSLAGAPGLRPVPISAPRLTLRVEVIALSATDPLLDIFR